MKYHLRNLLYFVLLACLLVLLLNVGLNNRFTKRLAQAKILGFAHSKGIDLSLEDIDIRAFPPRISLQRVGIDHPGFEGLNADSISLELEVSALLLNEPKVAKLSLDSLSLSLATNESNSPPIRPLTLDKPTTLIKYRKQVKTILEQLTHSRLKSIELKNSRFEIRFDDQDFLLAEEVQSKFELQTERIDLQLSCGSLIVTSDQSELIERAVVKGQGHLNLEGLRLTSLEIEDNRSKITSKTQLAWFDTRQNNLFNIRSKLSVSSDLIILGRFLDVDLSHGHTEFEGKLKLDVPYPDSLTPQLLISGDATVEDGYLDGFHLFNAKSFITINSDKIEFTNIAINHKQRDIIKGLGTIDFDEAITFDFEISHLDSELLTILQATNVDFDLFDFHAVADRARIQGTGQKLDISIAGDLTIDQISTPKIHYDHSRFPDSPHCKGHLALRITDNSTGFDGTSLDCLPHSDHKLTWEPKPSPSVHVSGEIVYDGQSTLSVNSHGSDSRFLSYFLQQNIAGELDFTTDINFADDTAPVLRTSFILKDGRFGLSPLNEAKGDLHFVDPVFSWRQTTAHPQSGGQISSSGQIDIDRKTYKVKAKATNLTNDPWLTLRSIFFPDLELDFGIKSLLGQIKGSFDRPEDTEFTAKTILKEVSSPDSGRFDNLEFEGKKNSQSLDVTRLAISTSNLVMTLAGQITQAKSGPKSTGGSNPQPSSKLSKLLQSYGFDSQDEITLDLSTKSRDGRQSLYQLPWIGKYFDRNYFDSGLEGQVHLTGKLGQYSGSYRLTLKDARILQSAISPIKMHGFIENEKVESLVEHAGQALGGRMTCDLSKAGVPFNGFLKSRQLDLRFLLAKDFAADARNYLHVDATWHLKGHFDRIWQADGKLALDRVTLNYRLPNKTEKSTYVTARSQKPVLLSFASGLWQMKEGPLVLESDIARLELDIPDSRLPEALQVKGRGYINLKTLIHSPLIRTAQGKILLEGEINGPIDKPSTRLVASAKGGENSTIAVEGLGSPIEDIKMQLVFENDTLRIDQFEARKGPGSINAKGKLFLSEFVETASSIQVNMNQVEFSTPVPSLGKVDSIISGDLHLSGNSRPFLLSGDININKSRSSSRLDIRKIILEGVTRKHSLATSAPKLEELPWIDFDINLIGKESILIRSKDLSATLSSDLKLMGNDTAPYLEGVLNIERGRFFYKNAFNLSKGQITFDEASPNVANLAITASAIISPYVATIDINGPVSDPLVNIGLEPPTREDGTPISKLDSLLLITSGRVPDDLERLDEAKDAGLVEAASFYTSQIPIDKIFYGQKLVQPYVDTTIGQQGGIQPRLNVPITAFDTIDAKIQTTSEKSNVRVSLPIHDSISLLGESSTFHEVSGETNQEENRIDLKFHFSFN